MKRSPKSSPARKRPVSSTLPPPERDHWTLGCGQTGLPVGSKMSAQNRLDLNGATRMLVGVKTREAGVWIGSVVKMVLAIPPLNDGTVPVRLVIPSSPSTKV